MVIEEDANGCFYDEENDELEIWDGGCGFGSHYGFFLMVLVFGLEGVKMLGYGV